MSIETAMLRAELLMLKTRYDFYAFSPAIYAVVKNIETEHFHINVNNSHS